MSLIRHRVFYWSAVFGTAAFLGWNDHNNTYYIYDWLSAEQAKRDALIATVKFKQELAASESS